MGYNKRNAPQITGAGYSDQYSLQLGMGYARLICYQQINGLELQVLLYLYRKTGKADLKVKKRFNTIVTTKPIFESNADKFQLVYADLARQRYSFYK